MSWFNRLCLWITIVACTVVVVSLVLLIWAMPTITIAKIALTSSIVIFVFGLLSVVPIG